MQTIVHMLSVTLFSTIRKTLKMAPSTNHQNLGFYVCFIGFVCLIGHGTATPIVHFNSTDHEIIATDHNIHPVQTATPVIYQGKTYYSFYISKNGMVAFTNDSAKVQYDPVDWSSKDISGYIDIPFIAPYYYNGESLSLNPREYTGHVRFQTLTSAAQAQELQEIGRRCRDMVVGSEGFDPTWGIAITWMNVTASRLIENGQCKGTVSDPCPDNSFQLILVTDGSQSYAVLNYEKMEIQPTVYDQAGFNGGYGTGWTSVLSKGTDLRRLKDFKTGDMAGRYGFKISSGNIVRAGCNSMTDIKTLNIFPTYAGEFGGTMIDISGPCFSSSQQIKCRFGKPDDKVIPNPPTSDAIFVSESRVRCVVPLLMVRDRIPLSLSLNGGSTYEYSTTISIVFPGRISGGRHLELDSSGTGLGWYGTDATQLTARWHANLLTNNSYARVDLKLIGYRQDNGVGIFKELAVLGPNLRAMDGQYSFDPNNYQCSGSDCFDFEVGVVQLALQKGATPHQHQFLTTRVVPIGWFVKTAMTSQYGSTWSTEMCVNWYNRDKQDMTWLNDLLHCPCDLDQALADFSRWQPDMGCRLDNNASKDNCFYHHEAVHCIRAVQPVHGAGNQCCYSKSGALIYAADTFQGSTPDRSHDWGAAPYGRPGYVPSLSHWIDDVVTFYYCCLWVGNNACDYYMDLRPTRDCTGYTPPVPAAVYGQGHVTTFGGNSYRMIGPGDYLLLHAGNTMVQGRFERNIYPTENGLFINSTYALTSVTVADKMTSDTVELQVRGPDYNTEYAKINVFVNGQYVQFDDSALAFQDFTGVSVINKKSTKQSEFVVLLANGIGFEVRAVQGTLQVDLNVPASTFHHVSGLFGDLDGNLTYSNGTDAGDKLQGLSDVQKYNIFQLSWAVPSNGSLFMITLQANGTDTRPTDMSPTPLPHLPVGMTFCRDSTHGSNGENKDCVFDYRHTGSRELAKGTLAAAQRYVAQRQKLQPVRSCGLLNIPRSTKTNYDYRLDSQTTITGCRIGSLEGEATYTCLATSNTTQEWSPAPSAVCREGETEDAGVGLIVGVVVAVVVVVGIAIAVAVIAVRSRRKHSYPKEPSGSHIEANYRGPSQATPEKGRSSNEYTI